MYILKAFRGSSTFEQHFTNKDAYHDQQAWLLANGWTIGTLDMHTRASVPSASNIKGH
jgi:hypothetical protein